MTAAMPAALATTATNASRPVRLPLQTGGASLTSLLMAAFIWTGAAFAACWSFVMVTVALEADSVVGPVAAGGFGILFAVGFARWTFSVRQQSRKQRASDVEIGAGELRFVDGPWDGQVIPWSEVESCTITTDTSRYIQTTVNGRVVSTEYLQQLWLRRRDGGGARLLLAESLGRGEKQSFEELRLSILGAGEARLGQGTAAGASAPSAPAPSVLQCQSCGHPVSPGDVGEAVCPSCGARVLFDAETREKIRAASAVSEGTEKLEGVVTDLLEQPSARAANRPIELLDKLVLALPVAAAAVYFVPAPPGGLLPALRLLAAGFLAAVAVGCFAVTRIVQRQALRELTMGMGARNAARPGEPPRCRQCGGTLLVRPGHVVAVCLFCQSENLLGLDLRPAAAAVQSRLYRLQPIVSKQASNRRLGLGAAALFSLLALRVLLGAWI
jgi:DNA-directed RNA polymerase subunit RPC12/RpoP